MSRVPKPSTQVLVASVFVLTLVVGAQSIVLAAGANTQNGGAVNQVRTVTNLTPVSITSVTGFSYVPNMSVTVKVPSGQHALFLITVSGAAACYGTATAYCEIEVEAFNAGSTYDVHASPGAVVFTSSMLSGDPAAIGTHSMEFTLGDVPAGTYAVNVLWRVNEDGATFDFGNRALTVLRSKM